MLLRKLFSMIIYGVEGAKEREINSFAAGALELLVFLWIVFTVLFGGDALVEKSLWMALVAAAIFLSVPLLFVFLGRWGRKK